MTYRVTRQNIVLAVYISYRNYALLRFCNRKSTQ